MGISPSGKGTEQLRPRAPARARQPLGVTQPLPPPVPRTGTLRWRRSYTAPGCHRAEGLPAHAAPAARHRRGGRAAAVDVVTAESGRSPATRRSLPAAGLSASGGRRDGGLPGARGGRIPGCLWKLGRLNHVAIAVPDLEKSQSFYKDVLGAQVSETVALPEHGVYTVFVELGNTKLELLHPLGEKSPIASFLQKNKTGGMHHICIEVDDIKVAMTELKKKKIRILSEEPKIGAHGKPVIFLHPKDCHGVLVELEQA
ncbi:methylmalonyl-CoA epimerase, mitochondrial isoform X1 [Nyctibius grandis]|uniref:methylmalonyl-CoA epimerase, mitochondrial isoform X1 n=1 Tax=Nyctibius grandis TaxID=48427 RepID=UPI0035BC9722